MKNKITMTLLLLSLMLLGTFGFAQTSDQTTSSAAPYVDGTTNPTAIPDSVAFRLVLLLMSYPENQLAHVSLIQLNADDQAVFLGIMNQFHTEYEAARTTYNAAVAAGITTEADRQNWHAQRDNIVGTYRQVIAAQLSGPGTAKFNQFVQNEKRKMMTQEVSQ